MDVNRIENSRNSLPTAIRNTKVLGWGKEAVVWTDEIRVYKVFDMWQNLPSEDTISTVKNLQKMLNLIDRHAHCWCPNSIGLEKKENTWILSYDYDCYKPYSGGLKEQVLQFLLDIRNIGIMFLGYRESSFRVSSMGYLILVDWGIDLVDATKFDWGKNAWKAWGMINNGIPLDQENYVRGFVEFKKTIFNSL